jgi:hypothetical protein
MRPTGIAKGAPRIWWAALMRWSFEFSVPMPRDRQPAEISARTMVASLLAAILLVCLASRSAARG